MKGKQYKIKDLRHPSESKFQEAGWRRRIAQSRAAKRKLLSAAYAATQSETK